MILRAKAISKSFGEKLLFKNLDLEIDRGESLVIVGKSGSGKSTLLNILSLIEERDSGDLYFMDEYISSIDYRKVRPLISEHIGYLFQNYGLLDNKSVYENINIANRYVKDSKKNKDIKIKSSLEKVGLKGYEDRKVFSLSGGEQQRVALARLLVKPSSIIFADEPTGNLDKENENKVIDILLGFRDEGKAVVVVSHNTNIINKFDKVIYLDDYRYYDKPKKIIPL